MTIQTINLGSYANDGTGDDLRTAFQKVNNNFNYITSEGAVLGGTNLGTGVALFTQKNPTSLNLEFKSLTSTDNSVSFASTGTTVNLQAKTVLHNDNNPSLANNLDLNGFYTYGGDTHNTVYGFDVSLAENFNSVLVTSTRSNVDMGSITQPTGYQKNSRGYNLDFNGTSNISMADVPENDYDFGPIAGNNPVRSNGFLLSLSGNLTTTGGNNITLVTTGTTAVTLPTSGTLATAQANLSQFSPTSSAQLASVITDETGSGRLVFNTSPDFSGTITANNVSTSGYLSVTGNLSVNSSKFIVNATSGEVTFQDGTMQKTAWPSTAGTKAADATGVPGQISWDANYVYICTATNTWKRAALTGGY